jgi:archaellum component FlaF (FlaF/FlaG flagellin family)
MDPIVFVNATDLQGEIRAEYKNGETKGLIFQVVSKSRISDLEIVQYDENKENKSTFVLLGEYDAGTITVNTSEGNVFANGIDVTDHVSSTSVWHKLKPGITYFKFNYQSDLPAFVSFNVIWDQVFEEQS